jgi:hypothetical protein
MPEENAFEDLSTFLDLLLRHGIEFGESPDECAALDSFYHEMRNFFKEPA